MTRATRRAVTCNTVRCKRNRRTASHICLIPPTVPEAQIDTTGTTVPDIAVNAFYQRRKGQFSGDFSWRFSCNCFSVGCVGVIYNISLCVDTSCKLAHLQATVARSTRMILCKIYVGVQGAASQQFFADAERYRYLAVEEATKESGELHQSSAGRPGAPSPGCRTPGWRGALCQSGQGKGVRGLP